MFEEPVWLLQPVLAPVQSGIVPDDRQDGHGPEEQEGITQDRAANAKGTEQPGEVLASQNGEHDAEQGHGREKRAAGAARDETVNAPRCEIEQDEGQADAAAEFFQGASGQLAEAVEPRRQAA